VADPAQADFRQENHVINTPGVRVYGRAGGRAGGHSERWQSKL